MSRNINNQERDLLLRLDYLERRRELNYLHSYNGKPVRITKTKSGIYDGQLGKVMYFVGSSELHGSYYVSFFKGDRPVPFSPGCLSEFKTFKKSFKSKGF